MSTVDDVKQAIESGLFDSPVFVRYSADGKSDELDQLAIIPPDNCNLTCPHCLAAGLSFLKATCAVTTYSQKHGKKCVNRPRAPVALAVHPMKELSSEDPSDTKEKQAKTTVVKKAVAVEQIATAHSQTKAVAEKTESAAAMTTKKKTTTKAATAKRSRSPTPKGEQDRAIAESDENHELAEDDNDEDLLSTSYRPTSRSKLAHALLPLISTNKLSNTLKLLATGWASEERILGKTKYYWHIFGDEVMKNIAATVPTTMEELREIDGLGDSVIKQYGDRIVKAVENFIEINDLGEYLAQRPAAKKTKVSAEVVDMLLAQRPAANTAT